MRAVPPAGHQHPASLRQRGEAHLSPPGWSTTEGAPTPQGATWIATERAFNFALYSKHAERVTLLLYGEGDVRTPLLSRSLDPLVNKSQRIWHCRIPEAEVRGARYYGYRVEGPKPRGRYEWHAFDPDKVLLDPYAREVHFPSGFERGAAMHPGSNAGKAPLGVLPGVAAPFDWGDDRAPRHEADLIIYELHVGGFTRSPHSGVAEERRGTYLGIIDRIPYLLELGVTAVELMPVFQWDPQEGNFWGYVPISFFAPHEGYASRADAQADEFRALVRALHAADIEVILDVVYSHTGEAGQVGPTYGFKGIDNSTYYLMTGDPDHPYADFSGTGNTFHTANAYVRKLILDSLRYWVTEMHVDGFRFDLASVFVRDEDGVIDSTRPGILAQISADPSLGAVRLIAEPWDLGAYTLGRAFPGISWSQWNDRFRDDLRRFVRGDPGLVPTVMARMYGSDDLFPGDPANAFHPFQSVNFVTSHDGFTLYDLLSYDRKRNWANGQANEDGLDENFSWNCGWEGDDDAPDEVLSLRLRQARNLCCLLLLANGTPMLRAGDEFLQTQGGNNNPYNQDSPTTWLDWSRRERFREVHRFFRGMIAFRKAHPSLCRSRFWRDDVRWHGTEAEPDLGPDSRAFAYSLAGGSQGDDDLYVMINASPQPLRFLVQSGSWAAWRRVVDTSLPSPHDIVDPGKEIPLAAADYQVAGRAVVVLVRPRL